MVFYFTVKVSVFVLELSDHSTYIPLYVIYSNFESDNSFKDVRCQ